MSNMEQRVATGEPGHIIVYHKGFLPIDRQHNPEVVSAANDAAKLAAAGKVLLAQRRLADGRFAYEATIAEKPGDYWTKPSDQWLSGVRRRG